MKKLGKVILAVSGAMLAVDAIRMVSQSTTRNTDKELETLIKKVYEKEASKIGMSDIRLEFDNTIEQLAFCEYTVQKRFLTIVDVNRASRIVVNTKLIQRLANTMFFTKKARKVATQYIVLHTIRHELRHAWQTVHNKEILMKSGLIDSITDMSEGYGNRPQEADANQYAEAVDVGRYNIILEACTHTQNTANKLTQTKEDNDNHIRISRGILKLNLALLLK